jgi:hypothetical protein
MQRLLATWGGPALALTCASALADVTIKQEAYQDPDHGELRETVYIKGNKLRMDIAGADGVSSQIIDLATGQYIVLIPMMREAWVDPIARVDRAATPPRVEIRATGESRQIAGRSAQLHDITVQLHGGGRDMWLAVKARVAIVPDAPGAADYKAFFLAAADYSATLRGAEYASSEGNAYDSSSSVRALAELYRAIAATGGVAYEVVSETFYAGTSSLVPQMNRDPGPPHRATVHSVSTQPLSDALFTVPKGYRTKSALTAFQN